MLALPLVSCSDDNADAQKISALVNEGAQQMLEGRASERIVIYHPDASTTYTMRLEKHSACASMPCDAPAGQRQGLLHLIRSGKDQSATLERWVSVPNQFEVTRNGQDTAVILQNKGWYAEVRAVY